MPDTKITALTAIGANPIIPSTFPIPMVDLTDTSMAASGTTKKVTVNQILGAGGTATLASATITGDLTVDTNTLKVDSANNRVGVGTASPAVTLDISDPSAVIRATSSTGTNTSFAAFANTGGAVRVGAENSAGGGLFTGSSAYSAVFGTTGAYSAHIGTNSSVRYSIASDGVATWSNVGGVAGTAMTLNSNGLGVGGVPSGLAPVILCEGIAGTYAKFNSKVGAKTWSAGYRSGTLQYEIQEDGTERFVIANGGNVGIGVTPSAGGGCLQLKSGITFPATQVASSDANTLDDYEEGTWAIGLEFGGASTGITTNSNQGKYTKIGNQVTINGYLALSNKGSLTGNAVITGLPFLANGYTAVSLYMAQITFADVPMGFSNNGTSTIILRESTNAGVSSTLTNADFANNSEIMFNMTYFV